MIVPMNVLRQHPAQTAKGSRSGARLAGWQRIGLIAYALFLGLALPFICWGNVADPTHPHQGPHFVFSAPPGETVQEATVVEQTTHHHSPTQASTPQPHSDHEQPARPVGQAHPTLLLMALLGIITTLLFFCQPPAAPTHWRQIGVPIVTAFALPVPVPPPRLLLNH